MCPCGVVPPPSSTYPRGLSRSPPRSLPEPLDAKLPITDFCLPRPTATNCPPPRTAPAKNGQQAGGQCPSSLWTLALGSPVFEEVLERARNSFRQKPFRERTRSFRTKRSTRPVVSDNLSHDPDFLDRGDS
ncbi:uncharacterized protein TNCT_474681 [Trichonephila clavata]|uniref:Uncharacterized protein n=1 Tax=Trichonephila clavata TaxID=2740835 RepID=A0A8X6KN73_TRICU|nr:uncharacterized protein TNCT_474681 [Trichonephila clavata]